MRKGVLIRLLGKGGNQGFTLIELLIVVLIVGILAAVATPLYLGYVRDAKTAEGKAVAGALWTATQSTALANCGTAVNVSQAYSKAGFNSSATTADGRWAVTTPGTLTVDCTAGTYSNGDVFTITGQVLDISPIVIKLNYLGTATPPAQLLCNTAGGTPADKC